MVGNVPKTIEPTVRPNFTVCQHSERPGGEIKPR
jgi:hypothetical protein